MSSKRITIANIAVTSADDSVNTVEVTLSYDLGGMNYFSGGMTRRGFYVSVQPLKVTKERGFETRSFTAFSGTRLLVEEAKRFSQKTLDNISLKVRPSTHPTIRAMIDKVMAENQLTLVEELAA